MRGDNGEQCSSWFRSPLVIDEYLMGFQSVAGPMVALGDGVVWNPTYLHFSIALKLGDPL